jgi:hypothetical protein
MVAAEAERSEGPYQDCKVPCQRLSSQLKLIVEIALQLVLSYRVVGIDPS